MKLDHALQLKQECFVHTYGEIELDVGLRTNSLAVEPVIGRQFSIGFSRRKFDDYHLELRLDKGFGNAHRAATKIKEKSPDEIHIGVIESLTVPAPSILANDTRNSSSTSCYSSHKRPLHIGVSISNLNGGVGTLGGFVENANGETAIISNCHVLAPFGPHGVTDRAIYQPGRQDVEQQTLLDRHAIATLKDHTTFSEIGSNYLDGAYAVLRPQVMIDPKGNSIPSGCPDCGARINEVIDYEQLGPNQRVAKIGRTTGYTTGTVGAYGIDDRIIDIPGHGRRRFDDLLEIWWDRIDAPFASAGDSGSLLYLPGRFAAIGLHFAGGILNIDGKRVGVSYACSLTRLLDIFGLTWI